MPQPRNDTFTFTHSPLGQNYFYGSQPNAKSLEIVVEIMKYRVNTNSLQIPSCMFDLWTPDKPPSKSVWMSRLLMSHSHYKLVKTVITHKMLKRARQALSRSQNGLSGLRKSGSKRPWLTLWWGREPVCSLSAGRDMKQKERQRRWGKQLKWSKVPYDTISVFLQVITLNQVPKACLSTFYVLC